MDTLQDVLSGLAVTAFGVGFVLVWAGVLA